MKPRNLHLALCFDFSEKAISHLITNILICCKKALKSWELLSAQCFLVLTQMISSHITQLILIRANTYSRYDLSLKVCKYESR